MAAASSSRSIRRCRRAPRRCSRAHPTPVRGGGGALGRGRPRAGDGRPLDASRTRTRRPGDEAVGAGGVGVQAGDRDGARRARRVAATTRVCYHDGVHSVEASNLDATRAGSARATRSRSARPSRRTRSSRGWRTITSTPAALERRRARSASARAAVRAAGRSRRRRRCRRSAPFARVAAGFWSTTLSPMHGAYLAATLARGGVTPPLRFVDRVVDRDGRERGRRGGAGARVIAEAAARAVGAHDGRHHRVRHRATRLPRSRTGRPLLPGVAVAGKTGSLNRTTRAVPGLLVVRRLRAGGAAPRSPSPCCSATARLAQQGAPGRAPRCSPVLPRRAASASPRLAAR